MTVFKQQVTVRDFDLSPALNTLINKRISKLDRFYNRIFGCHVIVELIQKHKHQGKLFLIKIDLTVPGKELVITKQSNEDIYVAIRDAFKALERKLENHARKRQGRVKSHDDMMQGVVRRIVKEDNYGFIEGTDGNEYYFSMTNMSHPEFNHLVIGDVVAYIPILADQGRQAQHVIRQRTKNGTAHN